MKTLILSATIKLLIPLFVLFSIYTLFRGHNDPGGGFIGGLIAALPYVFHSMTNGAKATRHLLRISTNTLISAGLVCALVSVLLPLLLGYGFMTSMWADFYLPVIGRPGTPVLFDTGVYLLVVGVVLRVTFIMSEE
jgi:multicomponent Na+:H+ antiporter subunit B